jgi:hypothetical protein
MVVPYYPASPYPVPDEAIAVTVNATTTLLTGGAKDWHGRPDVAEAVQGWWVRVEYEASGHATNDGQLAIAYSDDEGQSWTAKNTDLDGNAVAGFPLNPAGLAAGEDAFEPKLYGPLANGDILLHSWRYNHPTSGSGTNQWRSSDGGITWVDEGQINFVGLSDADDDLAYATDDYFIGPDGALYAGVRVYGDQDQDPSAVGVIRSRDAGATWEYLSTIVAKTALGGHGTQELSLTYVEDGQGNGEVVALIRDTGTVTHTYKATSDDLCETWTAISDVTAELGIFSRMRFWTRAELRGLPRPELDPVAVGIGFIHQTPGSSTNRRIAVAVTRDRFETFDTFYIDTASEDGGYGTLRWSALTSEWVALNYRGTLTAADTKQYRLTIDGI